MTEDDDFFDIPFYPTKSESQRKAIANASKERWKDQQYHADVSKKISETYKTTEMREVQASKSKPHKKETKEKIREAFLGKPRPPEVVKKIKAKRKGQAVYHKCFATPSGAFPSKKSAIEWATDNGVRNASGKFDNWIKTRPDEFYYITADEYEKIKDEPKQTGLEWMENSKRIKRYRDGQ